MKNKTLTIGAAAVAVVVTTAIVAGASYAYQGGGDINSTGSFMRRGGEESKAIHEEIKTAVENRDYEAWQTLMAEKQGPNYELITEENFETFAQMHEAMMAGDYETAQSLHEELGLDGKIGQKHFMGKKGMKFGGDPEAKQAWQTALENNDYVAWQELTKNKPHANEITEEQFTILVEAHKLVQEGKFEEARDLKESLGIGFRSRK